MQRSSRRATLRRGSACCAVRSAALNCATAARRGSTLRYELVGRRARRVLLVAGGISAGRHVVRQRSDFRSPAGGRRKRRASISARYRLLAIDWIGADGELDLPIDPADQADAIVALARPSRHRTRGGVHRRLLRRHGRAAFAAVIPARIGAHPRHQRRRVAPIRSPAPAARSSAERSRSAKRRGDPAAGVALARAMAMLTYRTPDEFAERFAAPTAHRATAASASAPRTISMPRASGTRAG